MDIEEMAADLVAWRFPALPDNVIYDLMEANAQQREFLPDARALKRIWKEMKRSEKAILFEDYDWENEGFGSDRQAGLSAAIAEAVKFDNELYAQSGEEIHKLYAQMVREQYEVFDKVRSEFDETAFFNEPEAEADFSAWMQMPMWSVNEATALSLGKSPDIVTPKAMKAIKRSQSNFAQVYAFRRTAIKRAVDGGQLNEPIPRAAFLKWAAEHQMALPDPLKSAAANQQAPVGSPDDRAVRIRMSAHQAAATTREDKSLHKIIAAMAIKKYGCGKHAQFSQAVNKIVDDLIAIDCELNDDTVRKHLRDALTLPAKDYFS